MSDLADPVLEGIDALRPMPAGPRQRLTAAPAPPRPCRPPAEPAPGKMRLQAVREGGEVVDFTWNLATGSAALVFGREPAALLGEGLHSIVAGPSGHPALIDRYRRVLEHGNTQSFEQVHLVEGRHDVVVHRVARRGDGVEVTLTNQSAGRRSRVAWLEPRPGAADRCA